MKRKSYAVSSSEEESADNPEEVEKTPSRPANDSSNELFKEILKNNKVEKLNFKCWKSRDPLFYDDISGDDEIYLVQCPKNTDLTALNNANVDFDSAVSNVRCRVNESKERLTVYSIDDFPSQVNLALPNRATKSFKLIALPVAGQLVMQKNIRMKQIKSEIKTKMELIDLDPPSLKEEIEIVDEIKSELSTSEKKRS